MGDIQGALDIEEPNPATSAPANAVAELVATRALALACDGQTVEAKQASARSRTMSSAAEPRLLAKLAVAVAETSEAGEEASAFVADAFGDVVRSGNVDAFVTAYRGYPALLSQVRPDHELHAQLATILSNANDLKLALPTFPHIGSSLAATDSLLSRREREVLGLVSQGLRNREIGQQLFISEVTVKAHVRNIMRKLGARSRTHAVSLARNLD